MTPPQSATARADNAADPAVAAVERPTPAGANAPGFGSDVIADALRSLDIPYIALTPGASYRGLHDSIVNYLGNTKPQMLLCLHEEAAVAIAHGYAKVTGKAMVTAVHSNVGLMHATHGDVQRLVRPHAGHRARRHRARSMPSSAGRGSTGSIPRAIRARWCANTPSGTTSRRRPAPRAKRFCAAPGSPTPCRRARSISISTPNCRRRKSPMSCRRSMSRATCRRSRPRRPPTSCARRPAMLKDAKQVLILAGRASRDPEAWKARVALAEALNARVVTDLKIGASFPTDHPLYVGSPRAVTPGKRRGIEKRRCRPEPRLGRSRRRAAQLRPGAVGQSDPGLARPSHPQRLEHGPSGAARRSIFCSPPIPISWCRNWSRKSARAQSLMPCRARAKSPDKEPAGFTNEHIARALRKVLGDRPVTYTHLPLSWDDSWLTFRHPLDYRRLRRRRRRRRRPGHFGRRGAGAEGFRTAADRDLRRRRFSDGRHRGVDRRALQDPAPLRARQQPLVL